MRTRITPLYGLVVLLVAGCSGGTMSGPGTLIADSGFRPKPNGFMFPNYGPDFMQNDILPDDLRRMFGDGVCAAIVNNSCILAPPIEQQRQGLVKMLANGHCEGFAVLSLLFYSGKAQVADFGAGQSAFDLSLTGNDKLQRELAYWWATQLFDPLRSSKRLAAPNDVVDALISLFKAGAQQETATMLFFKRDGKGGHAVTPYAVRDEGGGKVSILIYDNNFPGQERVISVDRNANTWVYNTAANPADPPESYEGDAMTQSIGLAPNSKRLGTLPCPVCGMATMGGPPPMTTGALTVSGSGNVVVTSDAGQQVGQMGGDIINNVPGASVQPILGVDPFADPQPPVLELPTGSGYTVTLDGSGMDAASPTDARFNLPGYTLGVLGANLQPGQQDTLTISAGADEVSYATSSMDTPTLELGIQTPDASWLFLISASGTMNGQQADLKIDLANQRLRVENANMDGMTSFDIEIHRIDQNGEVVFKHPGNSEASPDAVYLDYGAWGGDGQPMTEEIDNGGNGSIDSMVSLSDMP